MTEQEWLALIADAWGQDMPVDAGQPPQGAGQNQQPPQPQPDLVEIDRLRRVAARATLLTACQNIIDPPGADGGQSARITAERVRVTGLPAEPNDAQLADGQLAVDGLPALVGAIAAEIAEADRLRRVAARATLVAACQNIIDPPGADGEQSARITAQRVRVTGLPAEPNDAQLADGQLAVDGLPALVGAIAAEVAEGDRLRRVAARATLVAACQNIIDPSGADGEQSARITAERLRVTGLPAEPNDAQLADGQLAVDGLPALVGAIAAEIAEADRLRRVAARATLVAACQNIIDPPGADGGQTARITAERLRVTGLPAEPDDAELADGQLAVDGLPALVGVVAAEIAEADRLRRVAARATLVAACLNIIDPPGADVGQIARITAQRLRVTGLPAEPNNAELADGQAAVNGLPALIVVIAAEIVEAKRLADERKIVLADLAKTIDPAGANPAEAVRLENLRRAVRVALPLPPKQADIDDAKLKLKAVVDDIVVVKATIAARKITEAAVAAARTALTAAVAVVPNALRTFLLAGLTAITNDLPAAARATDYQAIDVQLAAFQAILTAAQQFGARQSERMALTPACVAAGADPALLQAALAASNVAAATGDFVTANARLDAFDAVPAGAATAGDMKVFTDAVKAFYASAAGRNVGMLRAASARFRGVAMRDFKAELSTIITNVTTGAQAAPAGAAAVTALGAAVDALLLALATVLPAEQDLRDAIKAAANPDKPALTAQLTNGLALLPQNPAGALAAFTAGLALPASGGPAGVAYRRMLATVQRSYDQLTKAAAAPGSAFLIAAHAAAVAKAPLDYAGATVDLAALQAPMTTIAAFRRDRAGFVLAASGLDAAVSTSIDLPVQTALGASDWAGALAALPTAIAAARAAGPYYALRAEVVTLRSAADATQQGAIDPVVAAAGLLAAAPGFRFAEAMDRLQELRHLDGVGPLAAEVAAYEAARKVAEAAYAKMLAAFAAAGAPAGGSNLVQVALDAARNLFLVNRRPTDGAVALAAVTVDAEKACRAAAERAAGLKARAAVAPVAALGAAHGADATPVGVARIAAEVARAAAEAAATAASAAGDAELDGGRFDAALVRFTAVRAAFAAAARAAANALELADGGHSLAAHGPAAAKKVPPLDPTDPQIIRVTTGVRADGAVAPSTLATTFEAETDWLAARQMGLEKVMAAFQARVAAGGLAPVNNQSITVIIEHGRPIDRCIAGQRVNLTIADRDRPGEMTETRTCSTYEEWTGLTRTISGFKYAGVHPAGTWKLHFQYPHADGWDNDRQIYTEPVPPFTLV